jgi:predicted O-methyltransferase YrrM
MFSLFQYFLYLLKAGNQHGLHSPFVYDLYSKVISDEKSYYAYEVVESLRAKLLLSDETIVTKDFGTGQGAYPQTKKISFIARRFATKKRYGQLLFRLINYFQPTCVLELGTSLGLATAYMASACRSATVYSLEGCDETAAAASKNLNRIKLNNVTVVTGEFDQTLPSVLYNIPPPDFIFLDGNHRYEATLKYFELCMQKVKPTTVMVFDDIHWSKDMVQAWNKIKSDKRVTVSVDLFRFGLVFFHGGQAKEDFTLRY